VAAGAGAFFADSIPLLLLLRALLGVSVGMVMPLSTGLLSFYFPPEEQSRLMGLSAAMNQMKYVAPLFFLAGYAVLAFWPSLAGMIAGSVLIGLANGAGVPYVNTIASIKGGKDAAVTVMPLISASLYLGQFLSPLIVSPIANAVGGSNAPYLVAIPIAGLFLLQVFLTRRHHALPPREEPEAAAQ